MNLEISENYFLKKANMNLIKYHKDVFFPASDVSRLKLIIAALNNQAWAYISSHAITELKKDCLDLEEVGRFLKSKQFSFDELFEYKKTKEGNFYNFVFRVQFNNYQDLVLVVGIEKSLISAWVQAVNDKHFTLNIRKYATA